MKDKNGKTLYKGDIVVCTQVNYGDLIVVDFYEIPERDRRYWCGDSYNIVPSDRNFVRSLTDKNWYNAIGYKITLLKKRGITKDECNALIEELSI